MHGLMLPSHQLTDCSVVLWSLAVADYAAQALVSTILAKHFPEIPLIGEEDAKDLNDADQHSVRDKIVELANGAVSGSFGTEADQAVWDALGREARSTEQWLEAIDRGNAQYSSKGRESSLRLFHTGTQEHLLDSSFHVVRQQACGRWTLSMAPRASSAAGSTPSAWPSWKTASLCLVSWEHPTYL